MIRITLATVLALPAVVLCTGIEHDRSTGAVISRPLALTGTECDASFGEQGNKLCPESHQVCAGFIHMRQWGTCVVVEQLRCSRGHMAVPAVRLNTNSSLEAWQYWGVHQHGSTPALFNDTKKKMKALPHGECPAASPFCIPVLQGGQRCHNGKALGLSALGEGRHCRWTRAGWPVCVECRPADAVLTSVKGGNETRDFSTRPATPAVPSGPACRQITPAGKCPAFPRTTVVRRSVLTSIALRRGNADVLGRELQWPRIAGPRALPACSLLNAPCFNTTQCLGPDREVLVGVHIYGPSDDGNGSQPRDPNNNTVRMWGWLDAIASENPAIRSERDPRKACLLVVHSGSFDSNEAMWASPGFARGRGANHLAWEANLFEQQIAIREGGGLDHGVLEAFDWGLAAIAATSLTPAGLRVGYDMVLPLSHPTITERQGVNKSAFDAAMLASRPREPASIRAARPWLLGFKGTTLRVEEPWQNHRWVLAEFLHDPDNGIIIDSKCNGKGLGANSTSMSYVAMLHNTTFLFAGGGMGAHSYRLADILTFGGIPVVTSDQLMPFEPEISWDACVVRVAETDLLELPSLLRRITRPQIVAKRKACMTLLDRTIGEVLPGDRTATRYGPWSAARAKGAFGLAMRLWHERIVQAQRRDQLVTS